MHDRQDDRGTGSATAARPILPVIATLVAVVVLLASQLPLAWAVRAQHKRYYPDLALTGTLPLYLDDAAADWSFMQQAKDGRFFMSDLYTVDAHPRNYVNLLLWSLGTLARLFRADVVEVYSLAKVAFGAILLAVLYALARRLFDKSGERFACFVMLIFGGGWEGPIAFLQRHADVNWTAHSPGWWMPEISTFFSMMLFPHMTAGFAAMIATLLLMLAAWQPGRGMRRRTAAAAGAGAVLFVLTLFHPFDTVSVLGTIWTVPLFLGLAERRWPRDEAFQSLVASLVAAPAVAYDLYLVSTNPAIRAWHLQGVMTTPEPGRLVMCFGVNALLAVLVLPRFRTLGRPQLVMLSWLASGLVLIHLPIGFQRRMMGGLQFPLAALACTTLAVVLAPLVARLTRSLRRRPARADGRGMRALGLVALIAPLNLITPCYVHQHQWRELRALSYPSWLRAEEFRALQALRTIAPRGARAIACYEIGTFIPPFSGIATYVGHNALTGHAAERRADVLRFYAAGPDDDAWRRELLDRWDIDFVFHTPRERALGGFDPSTRPWLEEVFVTGDGPARRAAVYRFR
ncbi:MAG TPA: hypothetical protein VF139_15065 [Candidatus Polarisedimenticolaceae bacterium]